MVLEEGQDGVNAGAAPSEHHDVLRGDGGAVVRVVVLSDGFTEEGVAPSFRIEPVLPGHLHAGGEWRAALKLGGEWEAMGPGVGAWSSHESAETVGEGVQGLVDAHGRAVVGQKRSYLLHRVDCKL